MKRNNTNTKAYQFFNRALRYPKLIISLSIILVVAAGSQLSKMYIDTSIESFIPSGHPSLVNRQLVRETFGLSDPIVVAVVRESENGAFTPEILNFISKLTEELQHVEGVDPEQVTSLATENNIVGTASGVNVEPFFEGEVSTQEEASLIRQSVMNFPLYKGNLVSEDGTTTLVVAELLDKEKYGAQAYFKIKEIAENELKNNTNLKGVEILVAGEGGVVAYQAAYIDGDAKKMTPLAFGVILLVLIIAFRTFRGLYLNVIVILGTVVSTMGIMALVGVPMYLTSNIIPVILIAISVADTIHILGEYYETMANNPDLSSRQITIITMAQMWRPITMTSVTNIAGFTAMGLASNVPPLQMVGIFSSIGVAIALFLSLLMIPSFLIILKPKSSSAYQRISNTVKPDIFGRFTARMGAAVLRHPRMILLLSVVVIVVGIVGTSKIYVDEASIDAFNPMTDIYKADRKINDKMNGSNSFDVMIETENEKGLYNPDNLKKIENLQRYIEERPNVGGTTSIVDVIKQLNKSLNENNEQAYIIPEDEDMVAQLLLLYSAGGDPTDLDQFVDYDFKMANIAVAMKDGHYLSAKEVIPPIHEHIKSNFNTSTIKARVAGWMNVFYFWLDGIAVSHFTGVILALVLVWGITAMNFRSVLAGLYTVLPVFTAMLLFYAILGFMKIPLNTASNIFGAIAIGVAVDFAIHIVEHLKHKLKETGMTIDEALLEMFPSTGRALLFNLFAVCLGFGVNMISVIPPFVDFGFLITACVASSFLASLTLLPALITIFQPKFLRSE